MAWRRPKFEQPTTRRCMWAKCPNLNMVAPDIDMCLRHAIIIGQRLEANAQYKAQREYEQRRKEEVDRRLKQNIATLVSEAKEGTLRRGDMLCAIPQTWVYYIRIDDHIKIGYTSDLAGRLRSYPPTAQILGIEYGDRELEKQRHEQFRAHLAYGREWFNDTPELNAHITTLPPYKHLIPKRIRKANGNHVIKPRSWR